MKCKREKREREREGKRKRKAAQKNETEDTGLKCAWTNQNWKCVEGGDCWVEECLLMQVVEGQVSLAGRLAWLAVEDSRAGVDSYLCEVDILSKGGRKQARKDQLVSSVFPG